MSGENQEFNADKVLVYLKDNLSNYALENALLRVKIDELNEVVAKQKKVIEAYDNKEKLENYKKDSDSNDSGIEIVP